MKRSCLFPLVFLLFAFSASSWGQCPEDTSDHGVCDTIYMEPWPDDILVQGDPPYFVRVPIYVTNDVPDPTTDSIMSFAIPLCYTHTNPSKYCSVSAYWNNTKLYPSNKRVRSIFRHLEISPGDTMFNRMMWLSEQEMDLEWDTIILHLTGTYYEDIFWLAMLPVSQGQLWWEGSKVLLATMTFKLEDTMTICIDTCFWWPTTRLTFVYSFLGRKATPRLGSPHDPDSYRVCFHVVSAPNDPPDPFCLLFPPKKAFTPRVVRFDWETATDPNVFDQVKYDLYVSTAYHFPPDQTTIDSDLTISEHIKRLDYDTYYWKVKAKDNRGAETWSNQIRYFMVTGMHALPIGDLNGDGSIDIGDVVFSINYLYKSGPAPDPLEVGDCNCDQVVDLGDVVYLINYLFKDGPPPCCP